MKAQSFRLSLLGVLLSPFLFAPYVAADDLQSRAKGGDADAQYQLGLCYLNGTCRAKQFSAAAKWLRLAAEKGHSEAKSQLDSMEREQSVPKDENQALDITSTRDKVLKWVRENDAVGPDTDLVHYIEKYLSEHPIISRSKLLLYFGPLLLKSGMPQVLLIWGDQDLVLELSASQAKEMKLGTRTLTVRNASDFSASERTNRGRRMPPLFYISQVKLSGGNKLEVGQPLTGTLRYDLKHALPSNNVVIKLSYILSRGKENNTHGNQ